MNKPITNRVQKAVARGKVTQQPLLDVGKVSPLKKSTGELIMEGSTTAPDTEETVKGKTTTTSSAGSIIAGGYSGKKMSNKAWKEYLARETPERKAERQAKEVSDGVRKAPTVTTTTEPDTTKVVKGKTTTTQQPIMVKDKGDALQPWERRWSNRQARIGERDVKRDAKKDLRGLKRQAKDMGGDFTNAEINQKFRKGDYEGMGIDAEKAQGKRATARGYDDASQKVRTNEMADNQRTQSMKSGSTVLSNERAATGTDINNATVQAQKDAFGGKLTMKQNKRQDKKEGPTEIAGKSPSISVNNKGAQLKAPSLGTRSTTNVSNKDYNEALMTRMNANEDAQLSAGLSKDDRNKPMGSESAAKMRMDSNVGIKSKSPMKKGYFNKK